MDFHYNNHLHSDNKSRIHFFEFILIFFAVILGFVAENARENYVILLLSILSMSLLKTMVAILQTQIG